MQQRNIVGFNLSKLSPCIQLCITDPWKWLKLCFEPNFCIWAIVWHFYSSWFLCKMFSHNNMTPAYLNNEKHEFWHKQLQKHATSRPYFGLPCWNYGINIKFSPVLALFRPNMPCYDQIYIWQKLSGQLLIVTYFKMEVMHLDCLLHGFLCYGAKPHGFWSFSDLNSCPSYLL